MRALRRLEQIRRWHVVPALLRRRLRPRGRPDLVRLGAGGGAWIVPADLLDAESVCYCIGVGEDITFDRALVERFGCVVHAFDPTPRAIDHVREHAADLPGFRFEPVGVWSQDTTLRFYAPRDPAHVSHSAVNLAGTSDFFEAECRRLSTLMRQRGHEHLDLLKLDVEGAEFEVLADMLESGIRPTVVCVEFDQPCAAREVVAMCRRMADADYQLVSIDGWNYTYVRAE